MNKYETVFIINPSVEEAGVKELTQKFSDLINSDGKVESVEEMGKRKLAYEIKKNVEGIDKKFFDKYYSGRNTAVAYVLGCVTQFESPRNLTDYGVKAAPQSYVYIRNDMSACLQTGSN